MDINFGFNFWSILFLILGYVLGSFTKRVGKSNEIDQIIRDAAQIQATNRELEMANDKLNQTLFESTKENQRLLNELKDLRWDRWIWGKPVANGPIKPPFISTCEATK